MTPPTCHMILSPCPTTAAYSCIYSTEKQNSYCCAPIETAALALSTGLLYSHSATLNNHPFHLHRNLETDKNHAQELFKYQQQQKKISEYASSNNVGVNTQQQQIMQPCQLSPTLAQIQDNGCGNLKINNKLFNNYLGYSS